MYVPSIYQFDHLEEKITFMKKYSFATIVTNKEGLPIATQLPFVVEQRDGKLLLSAHFSLANEQANYIEKETSLVIFSEPHAYISPSLYDKKDNVPTWDYLAVHAYGKAKILSKEEDKIRVLEAMIAYYEKAYQAQWETISETYKQSLLKGIVAFEMEITELQGQKKLSQNKSAEEIQRIANHLEKSDSTTEKELAQYIRNNSIHSDQT